MRGGRARQLWSVPVESHSYKGGRVVALQKEEIVSSCLVVYVITGDKVRNLLEEKQYLHTFSAAFL